MIRKSFCRICTCMCGILVDVEGDEVRSVTADPDAPLTRGYSCVKGRAAGETHHHADRLLYPMMRKDGALVRASWEEVLDDLCDRLRNIRETVGPDAVGTFVGGGFFMDSGAYALRQTFQNALGTRSRYSDMSIDVMSKIIVPEMMGGFAGAIPRPDFGRCRMVIYVGTNPMVSHGHTSMLAGPAARLREFTAQGELWVLDPRRTETAARATRHLAPRPGSDYAVLAFLVREVLREGADRDYLQSHAQQVGRLAEAVEPFTLEHAASISGIAPEDLAQMLAAVRRAGRVAVEYGTGVTMSPSANVTGWLTWALMIVTGSLDREGGAWANPGFFSNMDRLQIPSAPESGWRQPGPPTRPELRTVAGEYPCVAMAGEIEAGNLRGMINLSGNLVTCLPDSARTLAALTSLDVLASIDILGNATTAISTHVLPAKDQLERSELSLALDGAMANVGGTYNPAMVAPRGEVRSYWWIIAQIGKRLGFEVMPGVDPDACSDEEFITLLARRGRTPLDTSGDTAHIVAEERAFGWMRARADGFGGFRLAPAELVAQLAELRPHDGLVLISRRQLHHHNSRKMDNKREIAAIYVNPEDARERTLAEGAPALLRSPHGEVCGQVKLDPTLARGALSLPHGWVGQYNVNQLTSPNDVDPLTGMPRFSNLPVELVAL